MGIRYGRLRKETEEVEWSFVSHCDCDGIGGFARLLREGGADLATLPRTRKPNRGIILPLWRMWQASRKQKISGARRDWALTTNSETGPSKALAWHLFSEAKTEKIRQASRLEKVTVNSFLLKHLDQAIRPELQKPAALLPWMIPVNLRGDVEHADDTENHVSFIEARLRPQDSAADIQQQISECLERGEHRANYLLLGLGGLLSQRAKVKMITKNRKRSEGNIGAFSNLGVWDSEKAIAGDDSWLFCPPVAGGQLLGAGCVTFRNRMSLTIQGHASLNERPEIAETWMQRWIEGIG